MSKKIKIFMFDFVPLKNKGEEAILRGIQDLLGYQKNSVIEMYFFDEVERVTILDNFTLLPKEWIFKSKVRPRTYYKRLLNDITDRIVTRFYYFLATFLNIHLIKYKIAKHNSLLKLFNECDLVLAGHDGVFSLLHSQIILYSKSVNKSVGTFGAGGYVHFDKTNWIDKKLLLKSINQADFFYVREEGVIKILNNLSRNHYAKLAPDPAFYMNDLEPKGFQKKIIENSLSETLINGDYLNVGVTIAHKRCNYLKPFYNSTLSLDEILNLHTNYLADTFDELIILNPKVRLIFLPHSLEKWPKNDVEAARRVIERMKNKASCILLDKDLTPRFLKAFISNLDFIIGQRAHSMIGAASVTTPYAALVASNDTRTIDILGKMCEQEDSMLFMDKTDPITQASKINKLFECRVRIKKDLKLRMKSMFDNLIDVQKDIHSKIK